MDRQPLPLDADKLLELFSTEQEEVSVSRETDLNNLGQTILRQNEIIYKLENQLDELLRYIQSLEAQLTTT
jgi:hypothetical protein